MRSHCSGLYFPVFYMNLNSLSTLTVSVTFLPSSPHSRGGLLSVCSQVHPTRCPCPAPLQIRYFPPLFASPTWWPSFCLFTGPPRPLPLPSALADQLALPGVPFPTFCVWLVPSLKAWAQCWLFRKALPARSSSDDKLSVVLSVLSESHLVIYICFGLVGY